MIKLVREHRLLAGVAVAALLSAVFLIWVSVSQGDPEEEDSAATATTLAGGPTSAPSDTLSDTGPTVWPLDASQSEEDTVRDGVAEAIGRLSFDDRVDSLATVNAGGNRWVLSEFPTDTRSRLIDEGLAGPDLDPLGGEVLLVEDGKIVRAFPMNEFPPSFLSTDGTLVYAGRNGDGGYPDSALLAINAITFQDYRVVMRSALADVPEFYGDQWEEAEPQQTQAFNQGDYLGALRAISASVADGDNWVVRDDPDRGLCATIGDINYGCDDSPGFVSEFSPAHTPRFVALRVPPEGIDYDQIGLLVFAYLPEGAEAIELRGSDGDLMEFETYVDAERGLWAAPVEVDSEGFSVAYLDGDGDVLLEWPDG